MECTELGKPFSASTKKYLEQKGWDVALNSDIDELKSGQKIKLKIVNAVSLGNAFTRHHKSVSVEAELFEDGKLVDTYTGNRSSNGGITGGFKSSCSILARCVNILGNDVSKWLKKKQG